MNQWDIIKVTLYEATANLASATIFGFVIGVIAAALTAALFLTTVEMPFTLIVRIIIFI